MTAAFPQRRDVDLDHLRDRARWIRLETLRLVAIARSGHYSSTFSCGELLAVLYYHHLRLNPAQPRWADRDRFVMSKGHAAVGLYPVLADLGFYPMSDLDDYTRVGSEFADHPKLTIPGCDFGSGSLGHGLSVSAGMALEGRRARRDFRVHCMLGDAELNEGQIWEAAMAASHFGLGNLIAVVDRNGMGLDGFTEEVMPVEPIRGKFEAFGWHVEEVDGHDVEALAAPARQPRHGRPLLVIARTRSWQGIPSLQARAPRFHYVRFRPSEAERALADLGLTRQEVPR
jgi:transketolase